MGSFDDGSLVDVLEGVHPERQIIIYSRNKETEIYRGIYAGLPYCYVDDILLEAVDCYLSDGKLEIVVVDCDGE
ncbi:hypothetical protein ACTUHY_00460 [Acidaminococcus sp. LBK-2]|uniref:hypothetical protein n=1 Tax=Acidaminococcus sp. LBK-2 TaxID=3456956 RepID=UPI003FA4A8D6